jgi:peptidoglycan/xylan/chitin deacetylase (PgdA/CDA1 family)
MKKQLAARLLGITGLRIPLGRLGQWSGVIVLNYHRVGSGHASVFDRELWSADAEAFADQIRFCKTQFDLITPDDLRGVLASGRGRYCLITFDDGYRDNYDVAFPVLKSEGVAATFFIATGFIDAPRLPWWDEIAWMVRMSRRKALELPAWISGPIVFDEPERQQAIRMVLRAYKSLATDSAEEYLEAVARATGSGRYTAAANDLWMNWAMLREMDRAGMTIGGHTISHPVLARSSIEVQRREILGCGARLTEAIGKPMRYFSYPVGGPTAFDSRTREILRQAGVEFAFSYYGGFRKFAEWDDYHVRRVPVESYITPDWFRSITSLPHLFA